MESSITLQLTPSEQIIVQLLRVVGEKDAIITKLTAQVEILSRQDPRYPEAKEEHKQ